MLSVGARGVLAELTSKEVLRESLELVATMKEAEDRGGAWLNIVIIQSDAGDVEGAKKTAALMEGGDHAMRFVGRAMAKQGDLKGVTAILEATKEEGTRNQLFMHIVDLHLAKKDVASGQAVVAKIEDSTTKGYVQCRIAEAQAGNGEFKAALATVDGISEDRVKVHGYVSLAEVVGKKGDKAGRKELILRARETAKTIQGEMKGLAWAEVARAEVKAGNVAGVKEIIVATTDPEEKDYLLADIALEQIEVGDDAGARETMAQVKLSAVKARIMGHLAELVAKKDMAGARELIRAAKAIPLKDSDRVTQVQTLQDLLTSQTKMGDGEAALAFARSMGNEVDKVEALAAVARGLVEREAGAREGKK
jgi:hypothetical protein